MDRLSNNISSDKPTDLKYIEQILRDLGTFYYWPNNGNLGDLLIAEATRQYFTRTGIIWKEYDPNTPPDEANIVLVYGGGGRFTSHWGGIEEHLEHLTHSRVKRGIILPHSFYEVDNFILSLDERHTVICRENRSFEYCISLSPRATVLKGDDMGLQLELSKLPSLSNIPQLSQKATTEEIQQANLLKNGWRNELQRRVKRATVFYKQQGINKKVAFILRTDKEKSSLLQSPFSYDISLAWCSSCTATPYNPYFIRTFAETLKYPDIIVTDRLHVGIMAYLLNKEVYLLDNDYGKLSGVYEFSLQSESNIHLLSTNQSWPTILTKAWNRLNSPLRCFCYQAKAKFLAIARKTKSFLKFIIRK